MASQRLRKEVWKQTQLLYAEAPNYLSELFNSVPKDEELFALATSPSTVVEFIKADSVDVACGYSYGGAKVVLICDAQWDSNIDAVEHGADTQEADCYRRSNYHKHLQIQKYYPLGPLDTILSKNVEFFRVGVDRQYFFIDRPQHIDIVTSPALDQPALLEGGRYFASVKDEKMMENKIRIMFFAAAKTDASCLVIPAWGSKEHRCPAYHVGALFNKVIQENKGLFDKIVFAAKGFIFEEFKAGYMA
jgi:uncharacterized protein (TIGR02452 family)